MLDAEKAGDRFDDFTVNVFLEEDWLAHFVERPEILAFGDSPEAALKELKIAWQAGKGKYGSSNSLLTE